MATIIERLAHWARDLQLSDLPSSVVERVRLQHLSVAGAVGAVRDHDAAVALARAGSPRGAATLATGGTTSRRDAVRLHAALSAMLEYDDYLFMAHTGHGAVAASWAFAKGHSVGDLVVATAAANEVAGRLGASMLLGPAADQAATVVSAVAAATASAWLEGLDADRMADAIAIACATPITPPWHTLLGGTPARALGAGIAAQLGVDATELARSGFRGPRDTLDARDGVLGALAFVPLRSAFTGLGRAWLTETLSYKLAPLATPAQVAVQSVDTILQRHIKAADKRLRPDQVESVEVNTGLLGWAAEQMAARHPGLSPLSVPLSIRRSIGVLTVGHALGPEQLTAEWLAANDEAVRSVASKVVVRHEWSRTMSLLEHLVDALAPLLAGVTASELMALGGRAKAAYGVAPDAPGLADLLSFARVRPDRLMDRIRHASGDLADARLDQLQFRFDTEVLIRTSRGGSWPERRSIPAGSPGWPWQDTVEGVLSKFCGVPSIGDAPRPDTTVARALLDADADADAQGWVGSLLKGA